MSFDFDEIIQSSCTSFPENNEAIKKVTFSEALRHNKLTSPDIQKDITQVVAEEITNVIIKDLDDSLFLILIDKSRDILIKEQMVATLCYKENQSEDKYIYTMMS